MWYTQLVYMHLDHATDLMITFEAESINFKAGISQAAVVGWRSIAVGAVSTTLKVKSII